MTERGTAIINGESERVAILAKDLFIVRNYNKLANKTSGWYRHPVNSVLS